ncbi:hypothetical protein DPEC_G00312280 [Dallia pectoralis]|uniref:Uncharacterized protein n=1 Tax=Dallia pectoralis TaxID=75939 RepID=A0ACC2FBI0_DALPE|nr:hypothetical protein DPEC_G00312280 [Dallia pectoralis]
MTSAFCKATAFKGYLERVIHSMLFEGLSLHHHSVDALEPGKPLITNNSELERAKPFGSSLVTHPATGTKPERTVRRCPSPVE